MIERIKSGWRCTNAASIAFRVAWGPSSADFCHQCIERELCLIFSIHTLILAHPEILRCTPQELWTQELYSVLL